MSNYASHNTHEATEQAPFVHSPRQQVVGNTISVSVVDGQVSTEVIGKDSYNSRDLTPFAQDDWRSTALHPIHRSPAQEITADSLVTIGGMQGRVQDFVSSGLLQQTKDGFVMAGEAPQVTETLSPSEDVNHTDSASLPTEVVRAVDAALEPFDQSTLDSGLPLILAAMTGELGMDAAVRTFSNRSGLQAHDVEQRLQFVADAYQMKTNSYVQKLGIHADDLQDFYAFAKENRKDLKTTLQSQFYMQDMQGWKGLVNKFNNATAPTLEVLNANGFQVRMLGSEPEVQIGGMWMSVKGATKAGFL